MKLRVDFCKSPNKSMIIIKKIVDSVAVRSHPAFSRRNERWLVHRCDEGRDHASNENRMWWVRMESLRDVDQTTGEKTMKGLAKNSPRLNLPVPNMLEA